MTHPTGREKILIIENDLSIARKIAALCFALGHEPLVARDGFSGMLLARRLKPRVIFSDLSVPGLDGFEIVRRIRQLAELDRCAVVAITDRVPSRPASNQRGFDEYTLKPLNTAFIENVVSRYCAHDAQPARA